MVGTMLFILCLAVIIAWFIGMIVRYVRLQKMIHGPEEYDPLKKKGYVQTTGCFTGKKAEKPRSMSRHGVVSDEYTEYEVSYFAEGKTLYGWYHFYPAPDPEGIVNGLPVSIAYKKKSPHQFEIAEIQWDYVPLK